MNIKICDDRHLRSLTGISQAQLEILLDAFTMTYTEIQWQAYQDGLAAGTRQRRPGGGKKGAFPPEKAWFEFLQVLVDLSYQGSLTDYVGNEIQVPHKKPRKSKKKPATSLSAEQTAENQALSKIRIFVENAICGLKRYNILVHRFRNHEKSFDDDVIGIAAGL